MKYSVYTENENGVNKEHIVYDAKGKKIKEKLEEIVKVPGSKSVTNRALLMAALSDGISELDGVLFSDDSRHFLDALIKLGFKLEIDEENCHVKIYGNGGNIPLQKGTIDVGSAGTAARFITAMLALSSGVYTINCSAQMAKRPMKPLFDVLTDLGARFEYLGEEGFLPVKVWGNNGQCGNITMDISKSTQFLSAMLMVTPVLKNDIEIKISSEKKTGAYVKITMDMLKDFGINIGYEGDTYYIKGNQKPVIGSYYIEPDVSAACYFYAAAAITGGRVQVVNVHKGLMQGDMKFLDLLEELGCNISDEENGIVVIGPENGEYEGLDIDMNNFSDQALTFAAVAAFAKSQSVIRNVGHIRGQECNRMQAIVKELNKCGINAEESGDDIIINPGVVQGCLIDTYDDHRVAMSFSLLLLKCKDIIIDNPACCRKTFENYFEVFEKAVFE